MTYDYNDFNRMVDQNFDQNLDQKSHNSDIKTEKNKDSSTKPMVRFSEPIAEYRLIPDSSSSSGSSIFSDADKMGDESRMDSWATKGLKKNFWKLFIYICIFIFIGVIVLCGFFSENVVVQTVIYPVGVGILFCIVFYRAVTSSSSSSSSSSGFAQRDNGENENLEEDLLEDYDGHNGYENLSEGGLDENDIKSSI